MSAEPTDGALTITRFRDVRDCTRGERVVLSWGDLAAELTHHARRAHKDGPGWAPVTFSDEPCSCGKENNGKLVCPVERGHRIAANVSEVHALTLDVDKTTPDKHGKRHQFDQAGAEVALARLRALELRHIVHSTHSHAPPEKACYRVVVALSRSVASADFDQFWRAALTYLDVHHDPASKNTARFWYLPSCRPDAEPIAEVREGNPLDVEMIMAIARATAAAESRGAATRPRAPLRLYTPRAGTFEIDAFMAVHYPGVRSDDHGAGSRRWDIKCPWAAEHSTKGGEGDTAVFAYVDGKPGFKCLHGHCEGRAWRDFRRYHEPGWIPFDERAENNRAVAGDRDDIPPPQDDDAPSGRSRVDPNDPRPQIVLSTDQPAMTDAAERALARMGGVYVRGRQLVHVVRDHGGPDWLKRPQGSPVIVPIEGDHLRDLLGRAAVWVAMKDGKPSKASSPAWVAARLLARGQWNLSQLESVADAPVFRADGSIHDVPGYDERTRVIFDPRGAMFLRVPISPTQADAARAYRELLEPFGEFPYVADCDRAATIALVLSVIARAAIDGCVPMYAAQAPTPGTGKGLLVHVAAMIATGRKAPLMAPDDNDDEARKRLLAIAMESPSMVVIDNVEGWKNTRS